ncbi:uncharacterized protein LOC122028802 isoform X1 [Zingiber officinale]|uniref:uncharacterized protein LOC122028802 isoform X1 n=1 Tax=Zingiber officinale TaxID=94328 RepID=UPI001C4D00F0|nr:uncharacterized protein LOC122028802 isoform X1 [Zingiber officinale]
MAASSFLRGAAAVSGESRTGVGSLIEAGDDRTAGTQQCFEGKGSLLTISHRRSQYIEESTLRSQENFHYRWRKIRSRRLGFLALVRWAIGEACSGLRIPHHTLPSLPPPSADGSDSPSIASPISFLSSEHNAASTSESQPVDDPSIPSTVRGNRPSTPARHLNETCTPNIWRSLHWLRLGTGFPNTVNHRHKNQDEERRAPLHCFFISFRIAKL